MVFKTKNNKNNRNNRKSKKNYSKPENKIQFLNIGTTNTTIKKNDTVTNSRIDWSGNYNGKVADIHVSVDNNGRKEEMNIKLDNNDLTKLLGIPSINKQLDQRLMDDFYVRTIPQVYEPQVYEPQVYEPQVYEPQQYYNNKHNRQLVDIMDSLKFRNANGYKSDNNKTKRKNKRYKK
jgi:hypothetical protein